MTHSPSRRSFLHSASQVSLGAMAGSWVLSTPARGFEEPDDSRQKELPRGKAEHCVFIWLGGGACHIDTWDPKRRGDPKTRKPGSDYDAIETAISGTQICQHLPRCAQVLDRFNIVRTVNHDVIDEHAAAAHRVHTGRPVSGTIAYPSVGSVIAHQRGSINEQVPPYVLIGYPNITRGPGFLGAKNGYVYLTDTRSGPAGLTRPADLGAERIDRRTRLLAQMRHRYLERNNMNAGIRDYDTTVGEALRLSGPEFAKVFDLDLEPASRRESYGSEFGQRCLLARRLLQSGVRFVEVSHNLNFINGTGWDTHNAGQQKQHQMIRELDDAVASLVLDLQAKKMLDKTLIVIATEFGRPAGFDAGGGRGHYSKAFSIVLAGGGMNNGKTIGETNELGMEIVSQPVSIADLHATIYHALGIDSAEEIYTPDERPVPITDGGKPIRELFV